MSSSSPPGKADKNPVVQNGTANPQKSPTNKGGVGSAYKTSPKKTAKTGTKAFLQKSPEDMYDEIMELKKSVALLSDENSSLKAKLRRAEEESSKKDKQIEQLLDPNKNEELKRVLTDKKTSANVVVNNLKQKVFKLEQALKEKENALKKLQGDNKSTKIAEMKIQMDTYYKEILRLKNLNNLKETAKTTNDETIQKILIANKELEEENASLKKDLERALAVNGAKVKQEEYNNMSRTQLIGIISELDNKINTMKDNLETKSLAEDFKANEHQSLEELTSKVEHFKNKYTNLENTVQRLREDRLHYHELAESREQELKALRMLIDQMQKQMEQKPSARKPQSSLKGEKTMPSSGSETEPSSGKSPTTKPNVFDRLTRDSKSLSSRTFRKETAGSESESPSESKARKPKPGVQNTRNVTRGTATKAKTAASDSESAKSVTSPTSKSPIKRDLAVAKTKPKVTKTKEMPQEKQKTSATPDTKKPRKATSTIPPENIKEQETGVMLNKTTSFSSKPEMTKEKISITEENFSSVATENVTPVSKTVTYTVLKTVSNAPTSPEADTKVIDRRTSLSDSHVHNFRQNVAAKKIQKMWKHHQHESGVERQRQKVHTFRINKAARTIQRGWKKHSLKKNDRKPPTLKPAPSPAVAPASLVNELNLQHEMNLAEANQQFDPLNPFYEDDVVVIKDDPHNK